MSNFVVITNGSISINKGLKVLDFKKRTSWNFSKRLTSSRYLIVFCSGLPIWVGFDGVEGNKSTNNLIDNVQQNVQSRWFLVEF